MNLVVEKHLFRLPVIALALLVLYAPQAMGQDPPVVEQPSAPPPVRMITKGDFERLLATKDAKSRLRTTIEIAEGHLKEAEERTTQEDYDGASASLGRYRALLDDALSFLNPLSRDHNSTRDLYKRLELALRAQGPRLTAIRRTTPLEYAVWVKELEDVARKGRTDALNSFYGNTVIKDPQSKVDDKHSKKPKGDSTPPEN